MASAEYHREWNRRNKERRKEIARRYRERIGDEAHKAYHAKWARERYQRDKQTILDTHKRYRERIRLEVFAEYGGVCVCCGETEQDFLSIDHINGDGAAHRRELGMMRGGIRFYLWLRANGFPKDNFRLLCMNCNWSRGKYGSCPHERKPRLVQA